MKIRNQFIFLLAFLAAIPIFYLIGQAIYNFLFIPPELQSYKIQKMDYVKKMDLSQEGKKLLLDTIQNRPANVEDAFILADGTIIVSTIPEFADAESIELNNFLEIATNPSDGKLFQITTLPTEIADIPILHIIKFGEKNFSKHGRTTHVSAGTRYTIIIATILAEIICLIFSAIVSNKITKSITILKSKTELLADGKLETPITIQRTIIHSNEITDLSNNLETLRLTLKDQQNRRNRLIMGISHDLRTPISIIKGYTEAITDGLVHNKKKTMEAIGIIQRKTDQLEEMIETLIDFVKLNSAEWRNNLKELDLSDFMSEREKTDIEICEVFNRKVVASTRIPKGTMVKMDGQLVDRAITNILLNAIRYSNDGDTIYFKAIKEGEAAKISIRDTGIGISEEDLDQIFDIFYRASPSRREGGMGVGLSVVKNIVETHGWNIDVKSELGKGSEFIITIPLEKRKMKGATFIS